MGKEIWLGPLLGNNRARLIARCAELVAKGQAGSFLYLAASQPLLEIVTEGILDGVTNRGVWGELPVYLFRGFVRRVLSTAADESGLPLSPLIQIDREELPLRRSLISQILRRLHAAKRLKAIGPLAHREGCVNTITTLVGEIERAAKTPAEFQEIVAKRSRESSDETRVMPGEHTGPPLPPVPLQIDFDREVGVIYAAYGNALKQHGLTEEDADQLRALAALRGAVDFGSPTPGSPTAQRRWGGTVREGSQKPRGPGGSDKVDGGMITIPWLADVRLLVLDGFFDFTPVQGEMLRCLIPQVPEVTVNLNNDERNPEIFRPFRETIEQLSAAAGFVSKHSAEMAHTNGALADLRERLFNPGKDPSSTARDDGPKNVGDQSALPQQNIRELACTDRETEIRAVAKEIKRLGLKEEYRLADMALVVRERASYAETVLRVMRDEAIPCNLERRIEVLELPAIRAARKLFQLLDQPAPEGHASVKVSELADLIKSEYFRIDEPELAMLAETFAQKYGELLAATDKENDAATLDDESKQRRRQQLGIGRWDPDSLENTIAYVGGELRATDWLARARNLLDRWPQVKATRDLVAPETGKDLDSLDQIADADKVKVDSREAEKKRRPSRDVEPAAIAWALLVVERLVESIRKVPRKAPPQVLRAALMKLLDTFQFSSQVKRPIRTANESELPLMLDLHGLEALHRAFAAAIKSIEIAAGIVPDQEQDLSTKLSTFLEEVTRCLATQVQMGSTADRGGLRVLEATDVRGLRFRAVFIAGLIEGGFPLRASRDWIYSDEERERLKRDGLTLEDISPATLLKEEHYFYQAACRATDRLYLTRPLLLEDGSGTVASYYINELKRAITPCKLETEVVRRDFDGRQIFEASTAGELSVSLVRQDERQRHRAGRDGLQPATVIDELKSWALDADYFSPSALRRINIERERAGFSFGPYDGQITDEGLLAMLRQQFGSEHVHSASGLSIYGNCPYRFFANRVLRLEPRGEAALDLQAIDAGSLLHDVLRRFFERHRRQRLNDLDRDELRRELAAVADQVFDEHERAVPPLNPNIWKIDREIRKILLDQVLIYELGVQEKTAAADVRPAHFEIAFGTTRQQPADPISTSDTLQLTRSGPTSDEQVKIQGQIDRVDLAADGTLVAYDYKLSSGATADDMKAGRSLQIPIYLEALERLILPGHEIAGGGYYVLRDGKDRRNRGIYRATRSAYTGIGKTNSNLSDHEWRKTRDEVIARIWEFLDGLRAGRFVVTPSEGYKTCKFCDYPAVCRYDKYRIDRKNAE